MIYIILLKKPTTFKEKFESSSLSLEIVKIVNILISIVFPQMGKGK